MKLYNVKGQELLFFEETREKLVDMSKVVNTGYSGENQGYYGSNVNLYGDLIDVREKKSLYYKIPVTNRVTAPLEIFGCYDSNKNFLYKTNDNESVQHSVINSSAVPLETIKIDDGSYLCHIGIAKLTVGDDVAYVQLTDRNTGGAYTSIDDSLFVIGYEPMSDLFETWNEYCTSVKEDFSKIIEEVKKEPKVGVFIGDSLTNWGGGYDKDSGFLSVVHKKTGLMTKNEGTAGATWQKGVNNVLSAVDRVNTIISDGRKYDLYCFLMGTNGHSTTDTGETSENTTTMSGAIRYCLEKLKTYDPTAQILVCLPPQRMEGNKTQEQANEVIKNIAESYSVKTLDLYHHSGIVPYKTDYGSFITGSTYLNDGLHLGENGQVVLGNLLASEIKYLLCL